MNAADKLHLCLACLANLRCFIPLRAREHHVREEGVQHHILVCLIKLDWLAFARCQRWPLFVAAECVDLENIIYLHSKCQEIVETVDTDIAGVGFVGHREWCIFVKRSSKDGSTAAFREHSFHIDDVFNDRQTMCLFRNLQIGLRDHKVSLDIVERSEDCPFLREGRDLEGVNLLHGISPERLNDAGCRAGDECEVPGGLEDFSTVVFEWKD